MIFVKCVHADSVDVLIVELHEEFITITFGTVEVFVVALCVAAFPLLAALKYNLLKAVGGGALDEAAIMESVSELLEV